MLSIKDGVSLYHQTLTFAPQQTQPTEAKKILNKLLNNLHKQFPEMGSVYVQGLQKSLAVHYHVYFLFFDSSHLPYPESEMLQKFGDRVFSAWQKLQTGKLHPDGNEIHYYQKSERSIEYVLGDIQLENAKNKATSKQVHWWGHRPRTVFAKHTEKPNRIVVLRAYHQKYEVRQAKVKKRTSTERSRDWREDQMLNEALGMPFKNYKNNAAARSARREGKETDSSTEG